MFLLQGRIHFHFPTGGLFWMRKIKGTVLQGKATLLMHACVTTKELCSYYYWFSLFIWGSWFMKITLNKSPFSGSTCSSNAACSLSLSTLSAIFLEFTLVLSHAVRIPIIFRVKPTFQQMNCLENSVIVVIVYQAETMSLFSLV